MKKRALITGGSGLLGSQWASLLAESWDVTIGVHQRKVVLPGCQSLRFDWTDSNQIHRQLKQLSPDLIVQTSGFTSVEGCERQPDEARRLNVELATTIAEYCAMKRCSLIHISSDHLFDGSRALLPEDCPTCPLNTYGLSKAYAEQKVLAAYAEALVVRTNFFGWGPLYRPSFSDWIIDSLRCGRSINAFNDVFYTPIVIPCLVSAAMEMSSKYVKGIVHLTGPERLSKYDFAMRLARKLNLNPDLILPASIASVSHLVRRPLDMSLSVSLANTLLDLEIPSLNEQFEILAGTEPTQEIESA